MSSKRLAPQATSHVSSSHVGESLVCLHGVWCLCSNDQQVCSIVSTRTVWEKGSEPYTATSICQNRRVHPPWLFLPSSSLTKNMIIACKAHAISATVLASYPSLPRTQKILKPRPNTFSPWSVAFCLRFSFDHHVRDENKPDRSFQKTTKNLDHLLLKHGDKSVSISGKSISIARLVCLLHLS